MTKIGVRRGISKPVARDKVNPVINNMDQQMFFFFLKTCLNMILGYKDSLPNLFKSLLFGILLNAKLYPLSDNV